VPEGYVCPRGTGALGVRVTEPMELYGQGKRAVKNEQA